jgi:CDP-diacylglycerol--glycerol-3-phosphate 3-phosphatidyltransferase
MTEPEGIRPRVRDMPAPRENPSMAAPVLRRVLAWPYRLGLACVFRLGFHAWHLTVLSLAMNALIGVLLIRGERLVPGLLLIPAGLLDIYDGTIARMRGEESRLGGFLDSGLDRVSDAILFGALYWSLAGQGQTLAAALALATMSVSFGVSFVRAAAESEGVALGEGLFQRLERFVALMIGLWIPGALLPVLLILTTLGGLTLLQRLWSGARQMAARLPAATQGA